MGPLFGQLPVPSFLDPKLPKLDPLAKVPKSGNSLGPGLRNPVKESTETRDERSLDPLVCQVSQPMRESRIQGLGTAGYKRPVMNETALKLSFVHTLNPKPQTL